MLGLVIAVLGLGGCTSFAVEDPPPATDKPKAREPEPEVREPRRRGRRGDERRREAEGQLEEITFDGPDIGGTRSAKVHAPSGADGKLPVVVGFHGGKRHDGTDMAKQWEHLFEEPVLYVFPDGKAERDGQPGWQGVSRGGDPLRDVRMFDRLLDHLDETRNIDRSRVFVAGFSNGAYMAWHIVCHRSNDIAGALIVAKPHLKALSPVCTAATPKPLMMVAGTADTQATWDEKEHTLSVPDTVELWRKKHGCKTRTLREEVLPDKGDRTKVIKSSWERCTEAPLAFYKIEGGGHFWPADRKGPPGLSRDLDASKAALQFWRDQGPL